MSPPLPLHDQKLIELITLEFADITYQRKSTPAGRARKSAFSTFAATFPKQAVKWASCVEDARKVFVLSSWTSGTYEADRSLSTVIKPLIEHLSEAQWSRQLIALDATSVDTTSVLWGAFTFELRILEFQLPDEQDQRPTEYWEEKEEKISKALVAIRDTLTSFRYITGHDTLPPAIRDLGYQGLVGGWIVAEDGFGSSASLEADTGNPQSRKWAGIFEWTHKDGERKAWGEDGNDTGQECLQSLISMAEEVGQRWHTTNFETLGDHNEKYTFSSSDEDEA